MLLVPFALLVIIAGWRTLLGWDYYSAIVGSRDKALAALLYEAFVAGSGIFLSTYIFPGFFIKTTELGTGIQDHSISIDGRKVCFVIFAQNVFHLFYCCQHGGRSR